LKDIGAAVTSRHITNPLNTQIPGLLQRHHKQNLDKTRHSNNRHAFIHNPYIFAANMPAKGKRTAADDKPAPFKVESQASGDGGEHLISIVP